MTPITIDKYDKHDEMTPILFDRLLFYPTEDQIGEISLYLVIFLKENTIRYVKQFVKPNTSRRESAPSFF